MHGLVHVYDYFCTLYILRDLNVISQLEDPLHLTSFVLYYQIFETIVFVFAAYNIVCIQLEIFPMVGKCNIVDCLTLLCNYEYKELEVY